MSLSEIAEKIAGLSDAELGVFACVLDYTSRVITRPGHLNPAHDISVLTQVEIEKRKLTIPQGEDRFHIAIDSQRDVPKFLGYENWSALATACDYQKNDLGRAMP